MRYIMALLLSLALATPVLAAGFEGPGAQPPAPSHPANITAGPTAGGGFKGPGVQPVVTKAAQVQQAQDDAPVMLEGRIIEKITHKKNKYVFQDDSGKVIVEIGRKEFRGQTVTPQNDVRLSGHVDYSRKKDSKVDVDRLEVLK